MKHTPGPWKALKDKHGSHVVCAVNKRTDGTENWQYDRAVTRGAHKEANARLIAAAPDMLSMLKTILSNIEDGSVTLNVTPIENGFPNHPEKKIEALKSLINKAEGRKE